MNTEATAEERAFLDEQIHTFNVAQTGVPFGGFVSHVLRGDDGAVVAGVHGHVWGGCCEVHTLWVREDLRGQGYGSRLLAAVEAQAKARGCDQVILDTHSFQAPDFYRKQGYTECGRVDGYPHGHAKHYFRKGLDTALTNEDVEGLRSSATMSADAPLARGGLSPRGTSGSDADVHVGGPISLDDKFALIHEHWRPKVAASLNGQEVKLVKLQGVFPWHRHESEDELFLVWRGRMVVEFRTHAVTLDPGEMCVVPRGVEHRTCADDEAEVLIFEPAATRNTGDVVDATFTAPNGVPV